MKRWIPLVVALLFLFPQNAMGYSYGDPSQEVIAEALKEFTSKLNADTPDWAGAGEVYKVHRAEIESHFGASVAVTLDANIQAKDKDLFLANYKALLVMNLERRFEYAGKAVDDYSQAKLLLAKAKGTYDVLQPYVKADVDAAVMPAFDKALEALGNPGLFGVGKKAVDAKTFEEQTALILGKMKPLFPYTASKPEPKQEEPAKQTEPEKPAETPAEKPAEKPAPAVQQPETAKEEPAKSEPAKEEAPAKTEPAAAEAEQDKAVADEGQPAEQTADDSDTEGAEPAAEQPVEGEGVDPNTPVEQDTVTADSSDAVSDVESSDGEGTEEAAEAESKAAVLETAAAHAPMERTDKTNPVVTALVIAAVLAAAAGGIWFAKKQKLF